MTHFGSSRPLGGVGTHSIADQRIGVRTGRLLEALHGDEHMQSHLVGDAHAHAPLGLLVGQARVARRLCRIARAQTVWPQEVGCLT